ncbi:MAG TPA: hypothetical protein VKE74_25730, partial [Gemmataceae bacterium]|nr:hypothetical protein [Gemmataceae bacterium]
MSRASAFLLLAVLLAGCGRQPQTPEVKREESAPNSTGGPNPAGPFDGTEPEGTPNTLTPEEVAAGALLLFDGETTVGWQTDGPPARVEGGVL